MSALTEAEAKTKWCPEARIVGGTIDLERQRTDHPAAQAAFNMVLDGSNGNRNYLGVCAGSACMMWRWFDTLTDDGTACQRKPTPHAARTPLPTESPLSQRRGFCGLAGAL